MTGDASAPSIDTDVLEPRMMSAAELIRASRRALESEDGLLLRRYLLELRDLLMAPEELRDVLDNDFRSMLRMALVSELEDIPTTALSLLTDSLKAMIMTDLSGDKVSLAKILLKLMKFDVMLAATSSDLLVPALGALTFWCSQGKRHGEILLQVCPIEFLEEIYTCDCPLQVFNSYIQLIASIIRHGGGKHLLPPVLRIFARALRENGVGNTCEITETICLALANVSEDFREEMDEVLNSRLILALVRHVMHGACVRMCLEPMMKLFVNLMASSEDHCERFVDQGILLAMEQCLLGQHSESSRFTCMALTNAFAYSPHSIECALDTALAERLFHLSESSDRSLRKESLRAISNIFSRASAAQIFTMIKMGYVPKIVKLICSQHVDVISTGMHSLLAVIATTIYADPTKLPGIYEMLEANDVERLVQVLCYHQTKEIRMSAITLNNMMTKYVEQVKLSSGAIPRWSGMIREPTSPDLQSVMSLPM